jgi:hypothetical protein
MISLPIPHGSGTITFGQLRQCGLDIGRLVCDLTGKLQMFTTSAHLDPDVDPTARARPKGWRPAFGQDGVAQLHLERCGVGVGDLFLFFGWFRDVVKERGRYRYRDKAPDLHVIFGWLRVGEIVRPGRDRIPTWLTSHPHASDRAPHNTIYVADGLAGGGVFPTFSLSRQLTEPSSTRRSLWRLPSDFLPGLRTSLSYHGRNSRWTEGDGFCGLQSVAKGPEFVLNLDEYPGVRQWAEQLCASDSVRTESD